jgi:hypothetical protein
MPEPVTPANTIKALHGFLGGAAMPEEPFGTVWHFHRVPTHTSPHDVGSPVKLVLQEVG